MITQVVAWLIAIHEEKAYQSLVDDVAVDSHDAFKNNIRERCEEMSVVLRKRP